jgi:glycopeptide antibiotics resistance protein
VTASSIPSHRIQNNLGRAWSGAAAIAILIATLLPLSPNGQSPTFACIICGDRWAADVLANILLFAPLGFGLGLVGWNATWSLIIATLLSCSIELTQLAVPGRDSSIGDVLFNTVGTGVGWGLVRTAHLWLRPAHRRAAHLSLAAAAVAGAVFTLTGVLLAPSLPNATYWGQWTANLEHLEWYRGRVLRARVGPVSTPSRRLVDSETVRQLLLDGAPISVSGVAGPPVPAVAPLFSIFDEEQREIVLVGPDRDDLVFRYRTRAAAVRLDQPDIRLSGGMSNIKPGDPLDVQVRHSDTGFCLAVNATERCSLGHSLNQGWAVLLYPEHLPGWIRSLLDFVWVAGLILPVGFWARRRWESYVAGVLLLCAVVLVPSITALVPAPQIALPSLVFGVAAGIVLQTALRRRYGPSTVSA